MVALVSINENNPEDLTDCIKTTLNIELSQGATAIDINQTSLSIVTGLESTLSFVVMPFQASVEGLSFEYTNEGVVEAVKISETFYTIKAIEPGNTRITLVTPNGIVSSIEAEVYNLLNDVALSIESPEENSK